MWQSSGRSCEYGSILISRTTSSNHEADTSFELCLKTKPQVSHLRVFRSLVYAHVDDSKCTKLDAKGFRCVSLGYARNTKGYKVLELENATVKISRSIAFDERDVSNITKTIRLIQSRG